MRKMYLSMAIVFLLIAGCKKENSNNYSIDSTSFIEWKGSSPVTANNGTFLVTGNGLRVKENKVTEGSFTIPISSINVMNLTGDLKQMLTDHLKSPDFFNIALHPTAGFKITKVQDIIGEIPEGAIDGANVLVQGELTLVGVAKSIAFPAKIVIANDKMEVKALLKINRLDWGIDYAADPELGEHHIYPMVDLFVYVSGNKMND